MEGYNKKPLLWTYDDNSRSGRLNDKIVIRPTPQIISASDSNYTFSSDSNLNEIESRSSNGNPLDLNFHQAHRKGKLNNVSDSLERGQMLKKRNFGTQSDKRLEDTSIHLDTDVDRYTQLLNKMRPSIDIMERMEPLVRQGNSNEQSNARLMQSQPNIARLPTKSALTRSHGPRPMLRKEKTVGFSDSVDVLEVENWKIYNVDMAKKAREESRTKSGKVCLIF